MSDIFHSSKYMISRAKHHFSDFERQITRFIKSNAYSVVVDNDTDASQKVQKLKLIKPLPVALPAIAADTVNNLRSALDQAVFAITQATGVKETYFPFSKDAAHFQNTVKGRCKDLPQEITDLIVAFKPYKGGNDLLWALNELSNANKHAFIRPTAVAVGGMYVDNLTITSSNSIAVNMPRWDRAKNEMELFRQSIDGTAEYDIQISTYVAVCDIDFIDGKPAEAVLREFIRIVEDIVMKIEAESSRLGIG